MEVELLEGSHDNRQFRHPWRIIDPLTGEIQWESIP